MERSPRIDLSLRNILAVVLVTGLLALLMGSAVAIGATKFVPLAGTLGGLLTITVLIWGVVMGIAVDAIVRE